MADAKPILVGCGILKAEIEFLAAKNHWSFDTHFLPSSLHINFNALKTKLSCALDCHQHRDTMVFYGACHPFMENILADHQTIRTEGQNCVEMLLGREQFMKELSQGAFFLLEDWVLNWDTVIIKTFGNYPKVIKEIFQQEHKYLLCINTPCSHDFSVEAQAAAEMVGLPIKSITVSLDFLENTLENLLLQKRLSIV